MGPGGTKEKPLAIGTQSADLIICEDVAKS